MWPNSHADFWPTFSCPLTSAQDQRALSDEAGNMCSNESASEYGTAWLPAIYSCGRSSFCAQPTRFGERSF